MIKNHARWLFGIGSGDGFTIDTHCVVDANALTDMSRLEVGSPGVDRPLKTEADFKRFVGERVEIKLREAVDNQKVFSGELVDLSVSTGVTGTEAVLPFGIEFEAKKGEIRQVAFAFSDVERAKLNPVLDFKGKKR